jgi:hypothetical protein
MNFPHKFCKKVATYKMVTAHGAMALDSSQPAGGCTFSSLLPKNKTKQNKTTSPSHFDLAIYSKEYLKAKEEELGKLKYFQHANNIIFKKSSKKKPKSFKILFITLLQLISSFNTSQNYHLSKILI